LLIIISHGPVLLLSFYCPQYPVDVFADPELFLISIIAKIPYRQDSVRYATFCKAFKTSEQVTFLYFQIIKSGNIGSK
jgi:hypothetical protein